VTPAKELTTAGLLFMVLSLASVLTMVVFCYRRVLSSARRSEERSRSE